MLCVDDLKKDVEEWITNFVSQYNTELETVPCPYAKKAMLANQIHYELAEDALDIIRIAMLIGRDDLEKPVVVVGINRDNIKPGYLHSITKEINRDYLADKAIVALEDHPDDPETIGGVVMNQGKWALLLIQKRNELERARFHLRKTGYYDKWTTEQREEMASY